MPGKKGGKRPGAGRKPELKGGTRTSIYLDDETKMLTKTYMKRKTCGLGEAVREMLKAGAWVIYKDEA